ncbi:MAG: DUF58 domain-containing protein [Chloroflexota bacterium]
MSQNWWTSIILVLLLSALLGQNTLLLIGLLLSLVGGASHIWARYCLYGVTYQRRFGKNKLFIGEETELSMEVVNAKPLPLAWLITVDEFPSAFQMLVGEVFRTGNPRRRILVNTLSLRWYERVTRHYRMKAQRRGVWEFGPTQLSSGDVFGFSIKRRPLEEIQTIVVYPKLVPIAALGLPTMHPFGEFGTQRRVLEDPLRLMGTREYVTGDSYRHIHWKATARRQQLQTKVFEPSASRPLAIFLNLRTSQFIHDGIDPVALEFAISVAASIAHWGWQQDHAIGLYTNSVISESRERIHLRPRSEPEQLHAILEALARTEPDGRWTLNSVLKLEGQQLRPGTTIVAVTSIVYSQLTETLLELAQRQYSVTLIVVGKRVKTLPTIPGVQIYHLDRQEDWHELDALVLA